MNFWEMVDSEREYNNITRKELAYLADFSVNSIPTGIARGSIPAADVAYRIAKVLGVTVEYLLTGGQKEIISAQKDKKVEPVTQIDSQIIERSKKYVKYHEIVDNFEKLPAGVQKTLVALVQEINAR